MISPVKNGFLRSGDSPHDGWKDRKDEVLENVGTGLSEGMPLR